MPYRQGAKAINKVRKAVGLPVAKLPPRRNQPSDGGIKHAAGVMRGRQRQIDKILKENGG